MRFTTTVKVVLEGSNQPLKGVKVRLFDRDRLSSDDLLGSGETDDSGEARFDYTTEQFMDVEDRLVSPFPDLYAVVETADGKKVVDTRAATVDNSPRRMLTVTVPRDAAERHGLAVA